MTVLFEASNKHSDKTLTVLIDTKMSLDVNISEPEEFNCNKLHSSIEEAAAIKGIKDFEYQVDSICGKGDNYIANLFRVVLKDTDDEQNSVSVIVKTLVNTARQEIFHELHSREVNVYREVLPEFRNIQSILNEEDKLVFPECVLSNKEDGEEILILEDMKERGFVMSDKVGNFEQLNLREVTLILKELAKFHALSFIYQNQKPKNAKVMKSKFEDLMFENKFLNKSQLRRYYLESYETSLKVVDDINVRKSLEQIGSKLMKLLRFYASPKQHNVLCHGDCWINNILFRDLETEQQLCFLDFQAVRYANPATDIVHFLFLCTNSHFRHQHFDTLLDVYYESLCTFSKLFNVDINFIYPKENFDRDVKDLLPFGFLIALLELKIVTCTPEDIDALRGSKVALNTLEPRENELFKIRVNDVVREAIRNGVIVKLLDECNG